MSKSTAVTAAMHEILCEITNVIRKSEYAFNTFSNSDEALETFDKWQSLVFKTADLIADSWFDETTDTCEKSIDLMENLFKQVLPPKYKEIA